MIEEDREFLEGLAGAFSIFADCLANSFKEPIMVILAAELDRLGKRLQQIIDVEGPE